jgi:radical SAM superfamily enzyme YgiQ (UPF0313 family)
MKVLLIYLNKRTDNLKLMSPAPLTLPLLAAYTPPDVEVSIVDEAFETIDFDQEVDLVATTFVLPLAHRAYKLAHEFRKRGKTIVCGGPHATLMPAETARHFDSVVIGQGDLTWPLLLEDFKKDRLKKIYTTQQDVDMATIPFARRDLLNPNGYSILNTFQATRGCPYNCTYCTTHTIYPKFIVPPVRNVVAEIEQVEGGPFHRRMLLFWDDNLIGNPVWARRLFEEMRPLKKKWVAQLTFTITEDRRLVRAAAESGCVGLFFGLESFNSRSLKNSNKKHNVVEKYKDGIKLLHDHGISVYAGMMFGFDDDRKDIFEITLEKSIEMGIDNLGPKILVPYPGMPLFDRLAKENRIIHTDWTRYNGDHAVFHPRHMTAEELENGNQWFHREFHSYRSIAQRLWKSKAATWFTLPINLSKRKVLYRESKGESVSTN